MLAGISITFYYISQDLPAISERSMATFTLNGLALFFGTVIYLFEGIGLVLPLQAEMKEPKNFTRPYGVLNVGVLVLTSLVISFGFMGYWKFGEEVESSLIMNLPPDDAFYQSVLIIVAVGVALGYAIQFYIPIQILFPLIRRSINFADSNPLISEMLFRTVMVLVTFTVAILVPNIGLLISLIGAVCSNSLALVFPVIIEYLVKTRGDSKMETIHIVKNVSILLLALIGFLSGGFEAIRGIIALYT
jgi:proton-coupled amino acid transporter